MVNATEFAVEKARTTALEEKVETLMKLADDLQTQVKGLVTANNDKDNRIKDLEARLIVPAADFWEKLPKNVSNVISNIATKENNDLIK